MSTGNNDGYEFTQDWFHWAPEVWKQLIPHLPEGETYGAADRPIRYFLEIGSFEGRSMVWIAENMMHPHDHFDCIDTWGGGEEHNDQDMAAVEARFDRNLAKLNRRFPNVEKLKGTSVEALSDHLRLGDRKWAMDFIYIDGSHIAKDVLTDACMAWPLLKKGGLMVFDDYLWAPSPRDILHRPKIAIDAFVNIFAEEIQVVHSGYQLIIRKA